MCMHGGSSVKRALQSAATETESIDSHSHHWLIIRRAYICDAAETRRHETDGGVEWFCTRCKRLVG
jgi:hypothetical protein